MNKPIIFIFLLFLITSCKDSKTEGVDSETKTSILTSQTNPGNFVFKTPALQQDFINDPIKQAALNKQWNINLTGFTNQGLVGNPWNASNDTNITNYFNPAITGIPPGSQNVAIEWNALPGRINYYYPTLSKNDQYAIADTGLLANGTRPPLISSDPCDSTATSKIKFGPYGPRGFQDEYCEWSIRRDTKGNIIRIDFTCENPEYWNSVWNVDPNKVLELYKSTLDIPTIVMEDLYIKDASGQGVIDPSTGNYLYNPLNKWNSGSNGAMHLTSTPNTIQTEIGLGTSASLGRQNYGSGNEALLCCGQFGQKFRNSDPTIGGNVNYFAEQGMTVTLANPPGLYIQKPNASDFANFKTPDGTDPSTFWTTIRGQETLADVDGLKMPGNFILHAKYEVPANLGYTISDIKYNGNTIKWGSEIAQLINMHIIATAYKSSPPQAMDCVEPASTLYAEPLQLFYTDVYRAYNNTKVNNPAQFPMTTLSNSTYVTPKVKQGTQNASMVITVSGLDTSKGNPSITFDGTDITASVVSFGTVNYAVPGNSYPGDYQTILINLSASATATTGLRKVYVTNAGQQISQPMPALLHITN